jgi:hypothetical protein
MKEPSSASHISESLTSKRASKQIISLRQIFANTFIIKQSLAIGVKVR